MDQLSQTILNFMMGVPEFTQLFVLFIFSFAEGLPVIGSILPGGTIAIFAGTLASQGVLSPITTSVIVGLSSFLGDMTGFLIGKRFKNLSWVRKLVDNEKHQKNWDLFDRHIAIISIFGKLVPVVRSTPSIFAGARGIRARRYALYSFIGSVLWAFAGVYAGRLFEAYFGDKAIPFLLGIIVVSILVISIRSFLKSKLKKTK